jgi:hypothetical protein
VSGDRLGIDFGTSNTVAVLRRADGQVRPVLFDGSPVLPSAVYAGPDGFLVGQDAVHSARVQPERFEPTPKLRIDDGTVLLGDEEYDVVDVIAAVLRRVTAEASRPVRQVTLTYPAAWGSRRRALLVRAAATLLHRTLGVPPHVIEQPELAVAEGCLLTPATAEPLATLPPPTVAPPHLGDLATYRPPTPGTELAGHARMTRSPAAASIIGSVPLSTPTPAPAAAPPQDQRAPQQRLAGGGRPDDPDDVADLDDSDDLDFSDYESDVNDTDDSDDADDTDDTDEADDFAAEPRRPAWLLIAIGLVLVALIVALVAPIMASL